MTKTHRGTPGFVRVLPPLIAGARPPTTLAAVSPAAAPVARAPRAPTGSPSAADAAISPTDQKDAG